MSSSQSLRIKNIGISLTAVSGGILVIGVVAGPSLSENAQYAPIAAWVCIGALVCVFIGVALFGVSKFQNHRPSGRFDENAIRSINTHMSNLNSAALLLSFATIGMYLSVRMTQSSPADIVLALVVTFGAFGMPPLLLLLIIANGFFYRIATKKSRRLLIATTIISIPVGILLAILALRTIA
ncbi:hypothetical protein HY312_03720 [Candidatus Saccharibacteria bacterium]|nr:hypothetical protein [Candidatus Saccharibacteria bacterium]